MESSRAPERTLELDIDDNDDSSVRPPKKHCRSAGSASHEPGPANLLDIFGFADLHLRRLASNDLGIDFAALLHQRITKGDGIVLTSDYSGMGGAEEAMRLVAEALARKYNSAGKPVRFARSGDKSMSCRRVLAAHTGDCTPTCITGDILERLPKRMRRRLETSLANIRRAS